MAVWQMLKLAGETTMPYNISGSCEINKHSTSLLFSQKNNPQFLDLENDSYLNFRSHLSCIMAN